MSGPDLAGVVQLLLDAGAEHVYLKYMAPNDNSKNQPYLGGSFEVINALPIVGEFATESSSSAKSEKASTARMKGSLDFAWLDDDGRSWAAPGAQLILYPQYPEVRLSGFMRGAKWAPKELLRPEERGREEGRVLFLGVSADGQILGYLASPESPAARNAHDLALGASRGVLAEIDVSEVLGRSRTEEILISELRRIHGLSWIPGQSLDGNGLVQPYNAMNAGGYTLEAELGVSRNGDDVPDFMGWEIKQHTVKNLARPGSLAVTLLTPSPDGGDYADLGVAEFVRRYGYPPARKPDPHRINFGGIFRVGHRNPRTGLQLQLRGFNPAKAGQFDAQGAVELINDKGRVVASWSFQKMLSHWAKKHNKTAFVHSEKKLEGGVVAFRYGFEVRFGRGAEFPHVLRAFNDQDFYLDPAMKLVEKPGERPDPKSRFQFRMAAGNLQRLYRHWEEVDVRSVSALPPSFWT